MTAIDLIAPHLPAAPLPEDPQEGVCCITGRKTETIARKHVIKTSFTNLDLLRAPESDRASVAAYRVMGAPKTRQSSWLVTSNSLRFLDRVGVRDCVIGGVMDPAWAGYATTSYKKHGSLLAPVNVGNQCTWLFETLPVDCSDREQVMDYWRRLRHAQDNGISRPLIESLDIAVGYISKIGWRFWKDFYDWAHPRQSSPLYQFLTYLLPSQEELKKAESEKKKKETFK